MNRPACCCGHELMQHSWIGMHAAAAAAASAAAAAYMRASVAACVIDTVNQLIHSSAQTQKRESKFRIEISTCSGNPLRTSSGRCVPSQEDFYNTSIFLYENYIFHAWTKCTFGSIISIILVLMLVFRHSDRNIDLMEWMLLLLQLRVYTHGRTKFSRSTRVLLMYTKKYGRTIA
jgi:hypothetical protein